MPVGGRTVIFPSQYVPLKRCPICEKYYPLTPDFFTRSRQTKDGFYGQCKLCKKVWYYKNKERCKENHRKWIENNKERYKEISKNYKKTHKRWYYFIKRKQMLKIIYGITLEEYDNKLKEQNYVCKICGCKETVIRKIAGRKMIRPLCIDHDHKTKKIRGLLCDGCNRMLGRSRDNTFILSNAIKYLRKYRSD